MPTNINTALRGFEAIRHLVLKETGVLGPRRFDDERLNHADHQRVLMNYAEAIYGFVDEEGVYLEAPSITLYGSPGDTVVKAPETFNLFTSIQMAKAGYVLHFSTNTKQEAGTVGAGRLVLGEAIMRYVNALPGEEMLLSTGRKATAVQVLYDLRNMSHPASITREWVDWTLDLIGA